MKFPVEHEFTPCLCFLRGQLALVLVERVREKDHTVSQTHGYMVGKALNFWRRYFCVLVTISKKWKQIKHKLKLKDVLLVS